MDRKLALSTLAIATALAFAACSKEETTVAQQKSEMGRLAVERLAAALDVSDLDGRPRDPSARLSEVETIRLPMVLEVRDSTGPAPA